MVASVQVKMGMSCHLYRWLFALLVWLLCTEFLTRISPAAALKIVYCSLENEMASIGNNFTFYKQLDALYHQANEIQFSQLSPSSPTFTSLPRGVVVSTWNSNDTSGFACQLESLRKFCERYNYTHRVFAGNRDFEKQVSFPYYNIVFTFLYFPTTLA